VAIMPLLVIEEQRWQSYLFAALLAILGPAMRALDINDEAFGFTKHEE
jgi:hypothetical protein